MNDSSRGDIVNVFFLLGVLLGVCWGWLFFVVVDVAALCVILGGRNGR
jgi:hypothetical protein